jgi:hypothetical protein
MAGEIVSPEKKGQESMKTALIDLDFATWL